MFIARLLCSDPVCAEAVVAHGDSLIELETLLCACGWALEVIAWPDWEAPEAPPGAATVVSLRPVTPHAEAA